MWIFVLWWQQSLNDARRAWFVRMELSPARERVRVATPNPAEPSGRRGSAASLPEPEREGSFLKKRISLKAAINATCATSSLFKESKGKEAKKKLSLLLKGEDRGDEAELDQFMRQMLREEGQVDGRPWYSVRHNHPNKVGGSPRSLRPIRSRRRAEHRAPSHPSPPAARVGAGPLGPDDHHVCVFIWHLDPARHRV